MPTTIKLKNGSGAPLATDLVQGEVALDLTNKRIYSENAAGAVIEMGTSPSTIDINAGTIDGTVIGGASAAAGTFTTANATTVDTTNIEVTNVKAKDGTASATIADSTGVMTIASSVLTTADINGGTIDGVTIGGASAGAITGTTITGTSFVSSGDMTFGDNDKAIFGAGSDLQIYHDGSKSIIHDNGAGQLLVRTNQFNVNSADNTEKLLEAVQNAQVDLYYNNALKLATTNTGIDVTGTATMDGLTVDKDSATSTIGSDLISFGGTDYYSAEIELKDSGNRTSVFRSPSGIANARVGTTTNHQFEVITNNTLRTAFNSNGDISFYEDTGTTPKFFWDASAESLGIGTTSPSGALTIEKASSDSQINLKRTGTGTANGWIWANSDKIRFGDDSGGAPNNTRMCIETDTGNVGIGTTSPEGLISFPATASNTPKFRLQSATSNVDVAISSYADANGTYVSFGANHYYNSSGNDGVFDATKRSAYVALDARNSGAVVFGTGASGTASERLRIDSSGNVGIGTSSPRGFLDVGKSGSVYLGKGTAVGDTVNLYLMGSSTQTSNIFFGDEGSSTVGYLRYYHTDNSMRFQTNGSERMRLDASGMILPGADDAQDLGSLTKRYDDVYATNALIQTSDRNEKQDIEALSEAEQRVAVAAKGLLRKFRWKSKVAEKGDDARIHFGIIAQDLQAAFEAEGLDAGRYAMFIHSTWTDEETGEERSRMGVRYSELLAFIIAAI